MEVDPSWQGRGVGTSLLHAAESYLREEGCETIGLEAMAERQGTASFYESRGYRPVGDAPFFDKGLDGAQSIAPSVSSLEKEGRTIMVRNDIGPLWIGLPGFGPIS